MLMNLLISKIKQTKVRNYWRTINSHNFTKLGNPGYSLGYEKMIRDGIISVGKGTYGTIIVSAFGHKDEKLIIGNYCSIGGEVLFILGGNHDYKKVSTFPFKVKFFGEDNES